MTANNYQVGGTHYKKQSYQHWDFVINNQIPYMEAQIIRYVSRYRHKNGIQDLHKAKHFASKMIECGEKLRDNTPGEIPSDEILRFVNGNDIQGRARSIIVFICMFTMTRTMREPKIFARLEAQIEELIQELSAEPGPSYVNQG